MKARQTNTQNNQNNRENTPPILVSSYQIGRVREAPNGVVFADVTINGITIYGMAVRAGKNDEAFLAWPSTRGQDGKWYKQSWAPLSQESQDTIIQAIYDKMDGKA